MGGPTYLPTYLPTCPAPRPPCTHPHDPPHDHPHDPPHDHPHDPIPPPTHTHRYQEAQAGPQHANKVHMFNRFSGAKVVIQEQKEKEALWTAMNDGGEVWA